MYFSKSPCNSYPLCGGRVMVGDHQSLYSPSAFPRGDQEPNWAAQTINHCSVCGSTDLLQNIHCDFMDHKAQIRAWELYPSGEAQHTQGGLILYPKSLSPNHINYWNTAAIRVCTRALCQRSSLSQMPPRKRWASKASQQSKFQCSFQVFKHWRRELIFASRTQPSLSVRRVSQQEWQSWITLSALMNGTCLFISIRNITWPAPPCASQLS